MTIQVIKISTSHGRIQDLIEGGVLDFFLNPDLGSKRRLSCFSLGFLSLNLPPLNLSGGAKVLPPPLYPPLASPIHNETLTCCLIKNACFWTNVRNVHDVKLFTVVKQRYISHVWSHKGLKGYCESDMSINKWRVSWNYTYSPFHNSTLLEISLPPGINWM